MCVADSDSVVITFRDSDVQQKALAELRNKHKDLELTDREVNGQYQLVANPTEQRIKEIKNYALEQNITIIRNRVNELGVAEPRVRVQSVS